MADTRQICTFSLDDLYFGIDVLCVQEVIRYQAMTRVPLAPAVICGLMNLRGQIVTAIDLRRRLQLSERTTDELPMNVIVRTEEGAVSLLVDAIGDVLEISEDAYEPPPSTIPLSTRELTHGIYKLPERLLLMLDTEKAVTVGASGRAKTASQS